MPIQGIPITALQARTIGAFRQFAAAGPDRPTNLNYDTSAGGTATQNVDNVELSTDATAAEHAAASMDATIELVDSGLMITHFGVSPQQDIGNLAEGYEWGITSPTDLDVNEIAVFRPHAGQNTSGNVRVDSGGTNNDDSVTFPDFSDGPDYYSVVVDMDLSETRFHINSNPLIDPPEARISAAPNAIRVPSAAIHSQETDSSEVLEVFFIGWMYIP